MQEHPFLQGLDALRPLTWHEAFEFWRENEQHNPNWLRVSKERGFDSWEEWRTTLVAPFRLDQRDWQLYDIADPMRIVPTFRAGPFRTWIAKIYGDAAPMPTFDTVAARLTGDQDDAVRRLRAAFPKTTTLIGVLTDDGIVIVEGTHRCAAIALAASKGERIETDLSIALGSPLPGALPIVGQHRKGQSPT